MTLCMCHGFWSTDNSPKSKWEFAPDLRLPFALRIGLLLLLLLSLLLPFISDLHFSILHNFSIHPLSICLALCQSINPIDREFLPLVLALLRCPSIPACCGEKWRISIDHQPCSFSRVIRQITVIIGLSRDWTTLTPVNKQKRKKEGKKRKENVRTEGILSLSPFLHGKPVVANSRSLVIRSPDTSWFPRTLHWELDSTRQKVPSLHTRQPW